MNEISNEEWWNDSKQWWDDTKLMQWLAHLGRQLSPHDEWIVYDHRYPETFGRESQWLKIRRIRRRPISKLGIILSISLEQALAIRELQPKERFKLARRILQTALRGVRFVAPGAQYPIFRPPTGLDGNEHKELDARYVGNTLKDLQFQVEEAK